MKKAEIRVGGCYLAKVSGRLVTVRVNRIGLRFNVRSRRPGQYLTYEVTNLATGRRTVFRSAAKFREEAPQGADPSPAAAVVGASSARPVKPVPAEPAPSVWCEGNEPDCCESEPGDESCIGCGLPVRPREVEQPPDPTAPSATILAKTPTTPPGRPTAAAAAAASLGGSGPNTTAVKVERLSKQLEALGARSAPHLIVEARAGTGKTTTLIEGLKKVLDVPSDHPAARNPSPQQQAVWEAMARGPRPGTACFVAFNKSIATELQSRVPRGCEAMTMHSLGYRAVTKALGRQEPNSYVVQDLIAELLETDLRELRKTKPTVLKATEDLVSLCKMNLIGNHPQTGNGLADSPAKSVPGKPDERDPSWWDHQLDQLAGHYDVDLNGSRREVYDLVPRVLDRCREPRGKINFDDMIWLPIVLNLPVASYDLLLIDEAQDLNRCQQALAKKAGRRLVFCGDEKQAIYGFAGADSESLPRLRRELAETGPGVECLPLTVTRRCGKAIVGEARKTVPDFEAHETNPEGIISNARYSDKTRISGNYYSEAGVKLSDAPTYHTEVQDGDFVLCRCNAPLVNQCFRFLKAGRKANIQGRDVGQGLISLVRKLCYSKERECPPEVPITRLIAALGDWLTAEEAKEQAKRQPSAAKLSALQDRHDCLLCFAEGLQFVDEVVRKVEAVFTDDKHRPGVRLSSIHKAKGLEARRVFLLLGDGEKPFGPPLDKLQPWEQEQEQNLRYVAITRAIEELVYVT